MVTNNKLLFGFDYCTTRRLCGGGGWQLEESRIMNKNKNPNTITEAQNVGTNVNV